MRFFQSSAGRSSLPFVIGGTNSIHSIFGKKFWIESIFNRARSGVKQKHVKALILSLAVANILRIELLNADTVQWNLVWIDEHTPAYNCDDRWAGINVYPNDRPRTRTPTSEFIDSEANDSMEIDAVED